MLAHALICYTPPSQLDNREVWLGGYGFWKFRQPPTGVHDPVWVRAFVVSGNGTTFAAAIVDATGISNRMLNVRAHIQACTQRGIKIHTRA
jgi:hypothetical protein